jgi:hypothetical protein
MILIPVTENPDGSLSPSQSFPTDAVAIFCDGTNYTVYEPGDALPSTEGN